jgi:AcrR family transcriptional regulator
MCDEEVGATAMNRRVGAETSKTRDVLLDCVERLLLDEGYAGVSYRVVAAKAGVTASLVQYYFPTLDSLFVAMIRRLIERDTARWNEALQRRPHEPLRVLWEYSRSEAAGVLSMELMALGNHRPAVRAEITEGTERIRRAQLQALASKYGDINFLDDRFTPDAIVLLLTSMPKYLSLEDGIDVNMGHRQLVAAFEKYLDSIEPKPRNRGRKTSTGGRRPRS